MNTVRAFIAINIGNNIRHRLDGLQRELKKIQAEVRWVNPGNMHLTLAFLGEIDKEQIQPLETVLKQHVQGLEPFELLAKGTGFFGKPSLPRVIWAGIWKSPALIHLQRKTVEALQSLEIAIDNKPFSPHLTLGRVKGPRHIESLLQRIEEDKEAELGLTTIESVELIQSTLTPRGAEYHPLKTIPLG